MKLKLINNQLVDRSETSKASPFSERGQGRVRMMSGQHVSSPRFQRLVGTRWLWPRRFRLPAGVPSGSRSRNAGAACIPRLWASVRLTSIGSAAL
jgi:hypothetical protein